MQYEGLIQSYITEAITNGKVASIDAWDVKDYLDEFLDDESSQEEFIEDKGSISKNKSGTKVRVSRFE